MLLQERFVVGVLLFARVTALLASAPLFNNKSINPQVKVFLSAFLALVMTVAFADQQAPVITDPWQLLVLIAKEVGVGLVIGYSANLVFQAVRFAGGLIDFDMGYQTGVMFNPETQAPTLIGEIKSLAALMVFLILNGHHFLLEAVYASVSSIPIDGMTLSIGTIELIIGLLSTMFLIGVKIAAPVLVALFVTNLALALLARVAPQINIFVLSFQFKIIVGLLVMFVSMPILVVLIRNALTSFESKILEILQSIQAAIQASGGV